MDTYKTVYTGEEVDEAIRAARVTLPQRIGQIGLKLDEKEDEIRDVWKAIAHIDGRTVDFTPNWTIENSYLNTSGTVVTSSSFASWSISSPILLLDGMTISISTQGTNFTAIASTDSSASSYTPLVTGGSASGNVTYSYKATSEQYVAVCGKIGLNDVVVTVSSEQKYVLLSDYNSDTAKWMKKLYKESSISVYASPSGKLLANGNWASDSSCVCKKYAVTAGDILYLSISADTAGVFQFQNTATIKGSGNQTNIIGHTYTEEYEGIITVPEGATYLIVSQLASNTTNVVDKMTDMDVTLEDIVSDLDAFTETKTLVRGRNDLSKTFDIKSGYTYSLSVVAAGSPSENTCYVRLRDANDSVLMAADIAVGSTSSSASFTATQDYDDAYIYVYCYDYTDVVSLAITFVDGTSTYGRITSLDKRVSNLEDGAGYTIIGLNGKSDTLNKLEQMKRQPRVSATTQGITPFVFAHFSDLHADATNLARIIEYCNEYTNYIDEIIHTGDSVSTRGSEAFEWWANVSGSQGILNLIGNHDATSADDTSFIAGGYGKVNCYNKFIAPFVSNWGVIQPTDAAANGYNYYYKDYADAKVRIIALDCMYWDSAQNSWLQSVLADAKTNSLAVICFSHYSGGRVTSFGNPWTTLQYDDISMTINAEAPATIQSFIDGGGEFVAWFSGHTHYDFMGTLDNYPQQIDITIDTASRFAGPTNYSDIARVTGQKNQDLFNIVGVDTFRKLIKIYRVGADRDSWMRHKGCITIDYSTRQVLYFD